MVAARGISFDLHRGRVFGLVGESGCGKSSLARAIVGLKAPAAGTVHYQGRDLDQMDTAERRQSRREIQYLFQDSLAALSPRRTIWQTLLEPLALYRIGSRQTWRSRVDHVLATVDLQQEVLTRYPHELSGGQRQRVALARALVAEPKVIVADEPMSSLDVSVQARMIALIRKIQRQNDIAILFISHDLAVVQQLADDVAVMYLGQFVESGTTASIFANPAHPYTRALFASVPGHYPEEAPAAASLNGEPPSALTPPGGCVFHTRCPEVMNHCFTRNPSEVNLAAASGGNHIVRCHLWNS